MTLAIDTVRDAFWMKVAPASMPFKELQKVCFRILEDKDGNKEDLKRIVAILKKRERNRAKVKTYNRAMLADWYDSLSGEEISQYQKMLNSLGLWRGLRLSTALIQEYDFAYGGVMGRLGLAYGALSHNPVISKDFLEKIRKEQENLHRKYLEFRENHIEAIRKHSDSLNVSQFYRDIKNAYMLRCLSN